MKLLSKVDSDTAIIRDQRDGVDMRASIYHHAFWRNPRYRIDWFVEHVERVCDRPQLTHIDGVIC